MQEEVENKTVNIVVMTTRLTARSMIDGLRKYMNERSQMKQHARQKKQDVKLESKYRQKEQRKAEGPHGKQTVRQLVRHSNGLKQVPVQGEHLREFEKVLKKYGVDFAVMRETKGDTPRYLVFFKAKDESMISNVLQESTRKQLEKGKIEKKPSVLTALKKAKELVASTPAKTRQKEKDLSL